jgi:DNA-nicking Smr family endonuclease
MEEANASAVRAILEPQRYTETGCLDLHGLHVAEAEAASRDFVQQQLALRQFSEIEIITGAGHHSSGQVAKIKVSQNCCIYSVMHVDARLT